MPANLTSDYLAAEQDYQHAQTHQEKIAALEQMLATLPKHKGTEKMQADIKRRLWGAMGNAGSWMRTRKATGFAIWVARFGGLGRPVSDPAQRSAKSVLAEEPSETP
jgi:hypothetical protein